MFSTYVVLARWYDWSESGVGHDVRVGPGAATVCFGVEEPAFPLEFIAFTYITIFFFHAISVQFVELVGEAHIGVQHHLVEVLVARNVVNTLPLVFVRIVAHVSFGTPAADEH